MANGKTLLGQLLFGMRQVLIRYTQQSCDLETAATYLGNPLTEVTPTDQCNSEVKVYSQPDLSSYFIQYTSPGNIELPNVLTNLAAVYSKGGSDGDYTETASASASGTAWSVGVSVSGTAQASSYCIPKLTYTITTPPQSNVPIINCFFFSPALDTSTILSILTSKLGASVNAWPVFKPVPLTFLLVGERVTAANRRDYQGSASFSSSSGGGVNETLTQSDGDGTQFDTSPTIEEQQFPPTIHNSFSLSSIDSESHSGTTAVTVSAGIISGGGTSTATAVASGAIIPSSVTATSIHAVPTSGLYLYRVTAGDELAFGNFLIRAQVFDFSSIA